MKFAASAWLWLLLILPIVYLALLFDEKRKQRRFEKFADKKLWSFLVPEMDPKLRMRKLIVGLSAFGFAILALARPQFGSHQEVVKLTGLDIMIALDVSNSMEVEDVVPSRLKKAKHLIKSILDKLEGDRVGVAAFAASSQIVCPLTTDLSYVWQRIQILGPKVIGNQGTDIGTGLDTALKALDRGAEEIKTADPNGSSASHVIILITDGEDHEDQIAVIAKKIKQSGARLFVLGVGTEKGAPIPIKDENGNLQFYKKDRKGQPIVSSFHSKSLLQLATTAGGRYWNITPGETEVEDILHEIGTLNRGEFAERRYVVFEERFQVPLAIAVILLFLELSLPARRILIFILFLNGSTLWADGLMKKPAPLDSYLENQKGIEAYQNGKIQDAEKAFGAAQARDPLAPELEYNQGLVQLKQGDSDRAIESFGRAAKLADEKKDADLFGRSLYNLGKAFEKKGDIKGAVGSYVGAVKSAQETKDQKLENESRKNLQLLVDQIKKQQEQKKDDKQKQDQKQDDKQKQDQKQDDKQKQDQKQDDKQKQDQKQDDKQKQDQNKKDGDKDKGEKQEPKKEDSGDKEKQTEPKNSPDSKDPQKFQSKKMSPEDAERVMSELTNRERQLQERLQTQNAKPQSTKKDW
ncbi:MAG: VWA domain-containing protein [Bdellovibrionia bacterium]